MTLGRTRAALFGAGLLVFAGGPRGTGPYDIPLFAASAAPAARGSARLLFAPSPFGVAVTADGHARYLIRITATGLPAPSVLGRYTRYVAWIATPDLKDWQALGTVTNGTSTVGPVDWDKFLLVITAQGDSGADSRRGPTVLHGTSPSGWLQNFLIHPLFRGPAWGG